MLELSKEGKHILYFGASVEQTAQMNRWLNVLGVNSGFVESNTPTERRIDLISKFKEKTGCPENFFEKNLEETLSQRHQRFRSLFTNMGE